MTDRAHTFANRPSLLERIHRANISAFFAVQALRAGRLLSAKPFSTIIADDMGHMARMTTVAPVDFVVFKEWMSAQESREMIKRRRDALQAALVRQLVTEFLPQWKTQDVRPIDTTKANQRDAKPTPASSSDMHAMSSPAKPRRPRA